MPTMADRLRVGVVGCGLIAQVKHLPIVSELHALRDVELCERIVAAHLARGAATRPGDL
jgi:predicted dehydrogenase